MADAVRPASPFFKASAWAKRHPPALLLPLIGCKNERSAFREKEGAPYFDHRKGNTSGRNE